ncbi:MAG: hypothetical protein NC388_00580 [Clostridium sp.]|nr:hypothetical protein [Clostridium sp.]
MNIVQQIGPIAFFALAFSIILIPTFIFGYWLYAINRKHVNLRVFQVQDADNSDTVRYAGKKKFSDFLLLYTYGIAVAFIPFNFLVIIPTDELLHSPIIYLCPIMMLMGAAYVWIAYKVTPLCIFTDKELYIFPYYGYSSSFCKYEYSQLRWRMENVDRGAMAPVLYSDGKKVAQVYQYPKGTDDFVRERVQPLKQSLPPEEKK